MERSKYRTYAAVDRNAIRHNFNIVRSRVSPGCKVLSVVKADAYGHGAVEAARMLRDSDYFGVACPDEALSLRASGVTKPILIFGYSAPEEADRLADAEITQCAFSDEYLLQLQRNLSSEKKLKVHCKIDTGMSRLGFYAHDEASERITAKRQLSTAKNTPNLEYEGIFTHFTSSEEDPEITRDQYQRFLSLTERLKQEGLTVPIRHCANSAATLLYPEMHLDMVRPGIILYGYLPGREIPDFGLKPAMELKTHIAQIHHLKPGDTVSYNRTFRAERDTDIATICIGYADGLHRNLSGRASVLVNGHKTKIPET